MTTEDNSLVTLTLAELAYIGEVSRELGYQQAEADMAARWATAAALVRRVLREPAHDELQRRRFERAS